MLTLDLVGWRYEGELALPALLVGWQVPDGGAGRPLASVEPCPAWGRALGFPGEPRVYLVWESSD